ncbi:hypothetical protein GQ42DRAFT_56837 [Ramicandelaber brevisporus]|nr:hypothetical protein GQ42DRAFT_56837 [Ramicandelaber brevisporus]
MRLEGVLRSPAALSWSADCRLAVTHPSGISVINVSPTGRKRVSTLVHPKDRAQVSSPPAFHIAHSWLPLGFGNNGAGSGGAGSGGGGACMMAVLVNPGLVVVYAEVTSIIGSKWVFDAEQTVSLHDALQAAVAVDGSKMKKRAHQRSIACMEWSEVYLVDSDQNRVYTAAFGDNDGLLTVIQFDSNSQPYWSTSAYIPSVQPFSSITSIRWAKCTVDHEQPSLLLATGMSSGEVDIWRVIPVSSDKDKTLQLIHVARVCQRDLHIVSTMEWLVGGARPILAVGKLPELTFWPYETSSDSVAEMDMEVDMDMDDGFNNIAIASNKIIWKMPTATAMVPSSIAAERAVEIGVDGVAWSIIVTYLSSAMAIIQLTDNGNSLSVEGDGERALMLRARISRAVSKAVKKEDDVEAQDLNDASGTTAVATGGPGTPKTAPATPAGSRPGTPRLRPSAVANSIRQSMSQDGENGNLQLSESDDDNEDVGNGGEHDSDNDALVGNEKKPREWDASDDPLRIGEIARGKYGRGAVFRIYGACLSLTGDTLFILTAARAGMNIRNKVRTWLSLLDELSAPLVIPPEPSEKSRRRRAEPRNKNIHQIGLNTAFSGMQNQLNANSFELVTPLRLAWDVLTAMNEDPDIVDLSPQFDQLMSSFLDQLPQLANLHQYMQQSQQNEWIAACQLAVSICTTALGYRAMVKIASRALGRVVPILNWIHLSKCWNICADVIQEHSFDSLSSEEQLIVQRLALIMRHLSASVPGSTFEPIDGVEEGQDSCPLGCPVDESGFSLGISLAELSDCVCVNGHHWPRCFVTFAPVLTPRVYRCPTCGIRVLDGLDGEISSRLAGMVGGRCPVCADVLTRVS